MAHGNTPRDIMSSFVGVTAHGNTPRDIMSGFVGVTAHGSTLYQQTFKIKHKKTSPTDEPV